MESSEQSLHENLTGTDKEVKFIMILFAFINLKDIINAPCYFFYRNKSLIKKFYIII